MFNIVWVNSIEAEKSSLKVFIENRPAFSILTPTESKEHTLLRSDIIAFKVVFMAAFLFWCFA
jgi:hypothetical protein